MTFHEGTLWWHVCCAVQIFAENNAHLHVAALLAKVLATQEYYFVLFTTSPTIQFGAHVDPCTQCSMLLLRPTMTDPSNRLHNFPPVVMLHMIFLLTRR